MIPNDNVAHQLAYRKAERDKANLMYEKQQLETKVSTLGTLLVCSWILFIIIFIVNKI
jgi:hypothetical protein